MAINNFIALNRKLYKIVVFQSAEEPGKFITQSDLDFSIGLLFEKILQIVI